MMTSGCSRTVKSFSPAKYYPIDSNSILRDMQNGKLVNFSLALKEYEIPEKAVFDVVWTSDQYRQILSIFMQETQKEDITNWMVDSIHYYGSCSSIESGFESASINIFQEGRKFLDIDIVGKMIEISPTFGYIEVYDYSYHQFLFGEKGIDGKRIKISPERVIEIAEATIAKMEPSTYNDSCLISVIFQDGGWQYSLFNWNHPEQNRIMIIDSQTGQMVK